MDKYDIKAAHTALYSPSSADFTIVDVPRMQYLAVDGHGDPNSSPEYADANMVTAAVAAVRAKKGIATVERVRFLALEEGSSAQILHIGSYADEAPTLARLHDEYMPAHGLTFNGDHHEIYLSDVRRTAPSKLKTVLRQPVRPR
jgi:hypothetical protein